MSNMVTRCPQCQTSFKVTEEHLKIANGAVRCGSCLHVFQARQHWANPDSAAVPAPTKKGAPAPAAPHGKFQFDQSQIDGGSGAASPAARAVVTEEPQPVVVQPESRPAAQKKLEEIGDDDRISDDMDLGDEEDLSALAGGKKAGYPGGATAFGTPDDDYSSLFDDVDGLFEEGGGDFANAIDEDFNDLDELVSTSEKDDGNAAPSDESWAREMLEEIAQEDKPPEVDLSQVHDIRDILTDFSNPVDVDAARRDLGFGAGDSFSSTTDKAATEAVGRADLIANIEPPPLDLLAGKTRQPVDWKAVLLWNGAAAGLVLLLLLQYTFFQFETLAKSERMRPYIKSLCAVAFCTVPAVENRHYIKISNLIVRQHASEPDGLAIDAILLNTTSRVLPFPQLELYFSDMVKTPIASRRFEPAEYLSGEMSGKNSIPPGRPVHIALEIVNPGADAVNWSLQVAGKLD